jgi:hypothetical protein
MPLERRAWLRTLGILVDPVGILAAPPFRDRPSSGEEGDKECDQAIAEDDEGDREHEKRRSRSTLVGSSSCPPGGRKAVGQLRGDGLIVGVG